MHCAWNTSAASAQAAARAYERSRLDATVPPSLFAADASGCVAIAFSSVFAKRFSAPFDALTAPSANSKRHVAVIASESRVSARFFRAILWPPPKLSTPSNALSMNCDRSVVS